MIEIIKKNTLSGNSDITTANSGKLVIPIGNGQLGIVSTNSQKQTARRSISIPNISQVFITSGATASVISGTVINNIFQNGNYLSQVSAGTAGLGRTIPASQDATPGYFPHHSTGLNYIDWDKSWTLDIRASHRLATQSGPNDSGRFTYIIGNPSISPTAGAGHFLDAKGVSIKMLGKNGTTGSTDIWITAHNGTTETSSNIYNIVFGSGVNYLMDLELCYIAGVGLYLYLSGTLICSLITGLPTGASTVNHHKIGWLFENIVAGASVASTHYIQSLYVIRE